MTATLSPEFIAARDAFAAWYDNKSEDIQSLIDEISDRTHFIIDEDEYDAFIDELESHGIEDSDTFVDAFYGEFEGYGERILTEFAEQFADDLGLDSNIPEDFKACIDYNQYWYYALQHDFFTIEFKGNTYFFNNNY